MTTPLIQVDGVSKVFTTRERGAGKRSVTAVDDVTLSILPGETLGLVGESGSGKSTLGRLILQLDRPTNGSIRFGNTELTALVRAQRRPFQRAMQVIYQDPYASLNPVRSALEQVMEPLQVLTEHADIRERALTALEQVGIAREQALRLPRAFSGGQRQRIAIARAIAVEPRFIVCDEPVSALDVSIQAQVTTLLSRLQRDLGLTYLFISHDLAVVREIAHRTAVMYRGRVVEVAPTTQLFRDPQHPYTRRLLSAVLSVDPVLARRRLAAVAGSPPEQIPIEGELTEISPGHLVRQ